MSGTRRALSSVSAIVALLALSHVAQADVTGRATVIDGDTIAVAGERVRLQGIDAPSCTRPAPPTGRSGRAGRPRQSG
jgi:endonuclease YncB( thermonuclease family)